MKYPVIVLSLALTACGGGGTSGSSAVVSDPAYTILAFSATPSSIDPAVSSGAFTLSWTVKDASAGNYIRMYFSADTTPSDTADAKVFQNLCVSGVGCGVDTYTVNCTFNNSNVMSCGTLGSVNLTSYLSGLPMDGYLILQSCSDAYVTCNTKAIAITLQ